MIFLEWPKVEDLRYELPAETLEARWEMPGQPRGCWANLPRAPGITNQSHPIEKW